VQRAAFSSDGNRVVTASLDRTARIWDANTGHAMTAPLKHDDPLRYACFSNDGERIVTACGNGMVRIWDAATGRPLTEWLETGGLIRKSVCFDPTGRRIAVARIDGIVRVWDVPKVPTPMPGSVLAFAEAMAGIRVTERGNVEIVPRTEFDTLAQQARLKPAEEFYDRVIRWFVADPAQRPSAPF
jgi:hypothetical protein